MNEKGNSVCQWLIFKEGHEALCTRRVLNTLQISGMTVEANSANVSLIHTKVRGGGGGERNVHITMDCRFPYMTAVIEETHKR